MHYCCKGLGKCCTSCCKCFESCCEGCGKCCSACCKSCSDIFDRPFSSCAMIQFFLMFCPFVLCWAVGFSNLSSSCSSPVEIHLIIQGINLLVNFLIIFYLMYKYSTPQPSLEGKTYSQKLVHLICYDFVICFYTFFLAFEVAWNILGHVWLDGADCGSSLLEGIDVLAIIVNWIYLGVLLIYLMFVTCLNCCDGDCDAGCCVGIMSCFYYLCCCCCCFGKAKFGKNHEKKEKHQKQRNSEKITGWMSSFLRISHLAKSPEGNEEMRNVQEIPNPPVQHAQNYPQPQPANYPQPFPGYNNAYPQAGYNPYPQPGYNHYQQPGYYPQQHFK